MTGAPAYLVIAVLIFAILLVGVIAAVILQAVGDERLARWFGLGRWY